MSDLPKFFVPFAESAEQAERVYGVFVKNSATYPLAHSTARLYQISFQHNSTPYTAQVNADIDGWPELIGPVLGIIETTGLVCVHTLLRGGLSATPMHVSLDSITERIYFDDYSVQPSQETKDGSESF